MIEELIKHSIGYNLKINKLMSLKNFKYTSIQNKNVKHNINKLIQLPFP